MTDTTQPIRIAKDGINGISSGQQPNGQADGNVALSAKALKNQEVPKALNLAPVESRGHPNINGTSPDTVLSSQSKKVDRFDPNFTQNVINATGPKASARLRQVMPNLIKHLHDFARESEITMDELMAGLEKINQAGRMSDDKRNESLLMSDVLGLESLVDEITCKLATESTDRPTTTAVLGPFYRAEAPRRKMNETIVFDTPDGDRTYMYGVVKDYLTGRPLENAELDVWQAAPNGLYEQQDPEQPEFNLRGRFTTGPDGRYSFYCLRPTCYPVPDDGPAGKLLQLLDRHPMRPGHIHFVVSAPNYKPIITQLFDRTDKYVKNDAVFAVKESLVVDFLPRKGDIKANYELEYDFKLATFEEAKKNSVAGTTAESAGHGVSPAH